MGGVGKGGAGLLSPALRLCVRDELQVVAPMAGAEWQVMACRDKSGVVDVARACVSVDVSAQVEVEVEVEVEVAHRCS